VIIVLTVLGLHMMGDITSKLACRVINTDVQIGLDINLLSSYCVQVIKKFHFHLSIISFLYYELSDWI